MAEATVLHGSTALWALTPARAASHLRVVPSTFDADPAQVRTSTQRTAGFSGSEGTVTDTPPAARPLTLTRRGRLLLVGLHHLLRCCGLALLLLHLGRGRQRWRRLRRRLCRLLLWRRLLSLLLGPTLAWPLLLGMLLWVVGQLGQHIAQRLGHESGSVMTVAMRTCTAAYAC